MLNGLLEQKNPLFLVYQKKYDDDEYSQGYGTIKEAFTALTMNDILRPFIAEHDFRSANKGDNTGYILYVFDIRYQKNLKIAQRTKVEFKFSENVPAGIHGYA